MDNNKKLPLIEDLKSITLDFEHGKCKVNDFDIVHCSELSIIYRNNHWEFSFGVGNDRVTLVKTKFNN